ncbi:MAG: HesA/MoeB/ThiF family protein [Nanoarchaeota archaeon]
MRYSRLEKALGNTDALRTKIVSIVGLGALGTHAASLLARNGIHLKLFDPDIIEESNLSSQALYTESDLNKLKAIQASEHLISANSNISISAFPLEVNTDNVELINADVVLDCTDNFATRFLLNDFCKKNNIPLVHGAAIKQKGSLFVVKDVCLRCIYPELGKLETCSTAGMTNMTSSVIASLQVQQAMNILLDLPVQKDFLRVNLATNEFLFLKVGKNNECPVCTGKQVENMEILIKRCKERGGWSIKSEKKVVNLESIRQKFSVTIDTPLVVVIKVNGHEVIVHGHGELIVKDDLPMQQLEDIGRKVFS